jgi:rhodanese-related sulfurtransferase
LLFPALTGAVETPGVCHNELSEWIKSKRPLAIVDVQDSAGFRAHNYDHSLAAENDPVRLKKIAEQLRGKQGRVIVVSADGGQDAVRAAEQLARNGVKRSRILVLEGGMAAAAKNAVCDCCKPDNKKVSFK